jgi:hypothetical protein
MEENLGILAGASLVVGFAVGVGVTVGFYNLPDLDKVNLHHQSSVAKNQEILCNTINEQITDSQLDEQVPSIAEQITIPEESSVLDAEHWV